MATKHPRLIPIVLQHLGRQQMPCLLNSYAGNFSMVLTNLCPSGGSLAAGPKDAVTLLSIAWTGYSK